MLSQEIFARSEILCFPFICLKALNALSESMTENGQQKYGQEKSIDYLFRF